MKKSVTIQNSDRFNRHLNCVIFIIIVLIFYNCFGGFDAKSDKIIGNYFVSYVDNERNRSICISENGMLLDVVPMYVFAVGHNDKYIIAKQHPTKSFEENYEIISDTTNYYIIDVTENVMNSNKSVLGPLTKKRFDSLRRKLNIENILFDIKYSKS